ISPFGHPRRIPTAIEAAALAHDAVFLNGGQRGLQVRLRPSDLVALLDAKVAPLLTESRART
ncbi:MAG TPA: Cys-tRNA(Pro) deacylase, partial [Beijerinckiaceae bacterium]|nr:Cys-tRNA(Pro) deacylase [Beijerinckiaceae bacterium]